MIGLAFSDVTLGVLIGVLVIEIVAILVMAWAMLRKVKALEETIDQFGRVR